MKQNDAAVYQCDACQLHYTDRGDADKCERWCNTHQSCNLELVEKSIDQKAPDAASTS